MINLIKKLLIKNKPIAGLDAQWIGFCSQCNEYELQVSRNGLKNGSITHCYFCGKEKETSGFKEEDINWLKLSCKYHWQKYPIIPYNWHELKEEQKKNILKGK